MIASPTAASAAATAMTKNTNTCPPTPRFCASATNVRFHRVEHQLDAHEDHDHVAPHEHAQHAEREEDRGDEECGAEQHYSFRFASTTAPTMAASSSTLAISKGIRYALKSELATEPTMPCCCWSAGTLP